MVLKGVHPIVDDVIEDWDALEKIIYHIFYTNMCVDPLNHPIILVEPPLSSRTQREKICEILFETFGTPALLLVDAAVADLCCNGEMTGLDIRLDTSAYIVPVLDSIPVSHAIKKLPLGGVVKYLMELLRAAGHSFTTSAEIEIVRDIKEKLCYVSLEPEKETYEEKTYTLPDGETLALGKELFMTPELYFKPELIGSESKPLDVEAYDTLMKLDEDIRELIAGKIILSGSEIFPGMKDRLKRKIEKLASFPVEIRQQESQFSSWVGASVIGVLKHVKYPSKYWITKKEYYENPAIIHAKVGISLTPI
ncbi:MAG: actin, cytoplasmic 2 [Candidatus Lokiarchaeia archaeon]